MSELIEKIDDYLMERLPKADQAEFEQQIESDPELAAKVQEQRQVLHAVELMGDAEMKAQIGEAIRNRNQQSAKIRPINWKRGLAIAASVALLVFAYFFYTNPASNDAMYANYYETYNISAGSRSDNMGQEISAATSAYKAKNYQQALTQFEAIYAATQDTKWLLAQGLSQMELQQFDAALNSFQPLIQQKDPLYLEQALWYAALCHLKNSNTAQSQALLEQLLAQPSSFQATEAEALLKELRK